MTHHVWRLSHSQNTKTSYSNTNSPLIEFIRYTSRATLLPCMRPCRGLQSPDSVIHGTIYLLFNLIIFKCNDKNKSNTLLYCVFVLQYLHNNEFANIPHLDIFLPSRFHQHEHHLLGHTKVLCLSTISIRVTQVDIILIFLIPWCVSPSSRKVPRNIAWVTEQNR